MVALCPSPSALASWLKSMAPAPMTMVPSLSFSAAVTTTTATTTADAVDDGNFSSEKKMSVTCYKKSNFGKKLENEKRTNSDIAMKSREMRIYCKSFTLAYSSMAPTGK